jgi:hypothetical protein
MSKIVPLISSGVAGPLGALHLPRLWQKVSLEAAGKLADGYPGLGKGYDQMTCDALGLDAEAVKSFIKSSKPSYPQFEAWVKTSTATTSPSRAIATRTTPARASSAPTAWPTTARSFPARLI